MLFRSVTGMPYVVLMPIFADRILHSGATGLGVLMGATGAGAVVAALLLATRRGVHGLGGMVVLAAAGFGAGLIGFSLSRTFWLSALLLVATGFSLMLQMGSSNTLVQSMSPDHMRGRVMAVYSMMFMGVAPIGSLLAGVLAAKFGAPLTVGAGGAVALAAAGFFALRLPALRAEGRRLIVAQELAAGSPAQEVTGGGLPVNPEEAE